MLDGRQSARPSPAFSLSSNLPQRIPSLRDIGRDPSRRGQLSQASTPQKQQQQRRQQQEEKGKLQEPLEPQYVVYLRLPFKREGFVDPPQVEWDKRKEMWLWKVLNKGAVAGGRKGGEIDWDSLAQTLNVTRPFLLQQAAWLYKRQLSEIQAQMRRMGGSGTSTTGFQQQPQSPGLNSPATPGQGYFPTSRPGTAAEMRPATALNGAGRGGSRGLHPVPHPSSQPMSRTTSDQSHTTITQPTSTRTLQPPFSNRPIPLPSGLRPTHIPRAHSSSPSSSSVSSISSSSSSSEDEGTLSSHAATRRSIFQGLRRPRNGDDSSDDEVPNFLPFSVTNAGNSDEPSSGSGGGSGGGDMAGTITLQHRVARGAVARAGGLSDVDEPSDSGGNQPARGGQHTRHEYQSHSRSTSGDTVNGRDLGRDRDRVSLGNRHPALTRRVGEARRLGETTATMGMGTLSRGSSTGPGSPSMGSSFSDLSEESVSMSAMEEYLAAQAGSSGGGQAGAGAGSAMGKTFGGLMVRRWGTG